MIEERCIHCSLTFAVLNSEMNKIHSIVNSDIDLNALTDCNASLATAITENNAEIVELLLSNGSDPNLVTNDYNRLPIIEAIEKRNVKIINLLINSGATLKDVPVANYANNDDTDLYKFLIQIGFDINLLDSQTGRNSLHFSAMYGYEQLSSLLLENEINFQLKDKFGHTAYDLAKTNSHHKILELIENHKASNTV